MDHGSYQEEFRGIEAGEYPEITKARKALALPGTAVTRQ
jgi:hypothetical protein